MAATGVEYPPTAATQRAYRSQRAVVFGFLFGGVVVGVPLVFFRLSRVAPAFGTAAASAVVLSIVVGQIWASLFLRRVLPSPTGTLLLGEERSA